MSRTAPAAGQISNAAARFSESVIREMNRLAVFSRPELSSTRR
jgi:hypothetical protein